MSGNVESRYKEVVDEEGELPRKPEVTKREPIKRHVSAMSLQQNVEAWVRETFGEEAYLNLPLRMRKLWEEVSELFGAYNEADQKITPEFEAELADCYICLLALASVAGKNLQTLAKAKLEELGERVYEQRPDGTWKRVSNE